MKFSDIITLAKAGYKPGEIKELLALTTESPAAAPETEETPVTNPKEDMQPEAPKESSPTADNAMSEEIKQLKAQLAKAQADLAAAQQTNIKKDVSGATVLSPQAVLNDIVRSFM